MNILYNFKLNFKKLKKYRTKSLFLVIPMSILVALSLIITSSTQNIQSAVDQSIFGTIEEQSRLIELNKNQGNTFGGPGGGMIRTINGEDNNYTSNDLAQVLDIDGVEAAQIVSSIPVTNVKSTDIIPGKTVTMQNLTGLEKDLSNLYTTEDFTYSADQPIPVILNANTLMETYEDWGGQDKITITMTRGKPPVAGSINEEDNPFTKSPIKTQAITYDKEDLIGEMFTLNFGGLNAVDDYTQSFDETGVTFTKLTTEQIAVNETTRRDAISPYWNYDEISKPLTYTFKIVGIIEDESNFTTYIPADFANTLMKDYIQHQLDARTSQTISTDDLGNTFQGISYDGVEISSNSSLGGGMIKIGRPGETRSSQSETESYTIPGLVIETERSQSGGNPFGPQPDAIGEYTDATVYEQASPTGTTILIKTENAYVRESVVDDLNQSGYAYQDLYKSDVLNNLQDNLKLVTQIFTISFIGLTILIIIFTMGKFVSESKKEIGILRAIGAKKDTIRNLFLTQAILYTAVSYLIGTGVGLTLFYLSVKPLETWFNNIIGKSLQETYSVVSGVDVGNFWKLDLQTFGVYSVILLLVVIVIAFIPSTKAANISPVDAIKSE